MKYKKNKYVPKAFIGTAMMAVQGASALAKGISGAVQKRRAKKAWEREGKQLLEERQYKVPSMFKKMADDPVSDALMKRKEEQRMASQAMSLGAMKSMDPRSAMGAMASLERKAKAERTEDMMFEQEAQRRANEALAQQQSLEEQSSNIIAKERIASITAEKAAGQQNIMEGLTDAATAAASVVGGAPKKGDTTSLSSLSQAQLDQLKSEEMANLTGQFEEGGEISEDGGVTPGEFDHEGNPIDIVQDGEKIGEATGGELILPPDDVDAIDKALNKGDKDSAFELMKDLVAKYRANATKVKPTKKKKGYRPSNVKY